MLTELSLFSGYGGFSLGLRLSGLKTRTVAYVEWERYPQEIIKARIKDGLLDDAPIFADISSFRGEQFRGLVDIITGGFPCQPHSVAGLKQGASDERNLWPETLRVVSEVGPRYVLLENVSGILSASADGGTPAYGGTVVGELASIGYSVHWRTIGAVDVGAPHRRKRWWCIAVADADGKGAGGQTRDNYTIGAFSRAGSEPRLDQRGRELADSTGERSQRLQPEGSGRRQPQAEAGDGSGDAELAAPGHEGLERGIGDSGGEEWQTSPQIEYNRNRVRSEFGFGDGALADSEKLPRRVLRGQQPEQGEETGIPSGISKRGGAPSQELGGSDGKGLQGRQQPVRGSAYELPAWPPSPSDADGWADILRERPDLAPALSKEAESRFRGVDDGRPHRVDELKALGNGIVPAVVAEFLWGLTKGS